MILLPEVEQPFGPHTNWGRNAYGFEVDKNFYIAAMEKMIPGKKDGAE